jgi:hypothetical protein
VIVLDQKLIDLFEEIKKKTYGHFEIKLISDELNNNYNKFNISN